MQARGPQKREAPGIVPD